MRQGLQFSFLPLLMLEVPLLYTYFPYTTLFRSTTAVNVGAPGNTLDPLVGSLAINGAGVTNVFFNNQGANPAFRYEDDSTELQAESNNKSNTQLVHVDFSGVSQMTLNDPSGNQI